MLELANRFALPSPAVDIAPYGNGHINETYIVRTGGARYILQKVNTVIFTNMDGLMDNIFAVTKYLSDRDGDPRHVLMPIMTKDGAHYLKHSGDSWRMYNFIEDSICLEAAETPEDFEMSAWAFGDFQRRLADFPADTLVETIPHFHDTPDRYRIFKEAIAKDPLGRVRSVSREIDFALARENDAGVMMKMLKSGELPLRVTHNDTKLNNVLLDAKTRKPLCVVDLDTVMPGLAGNDFGDSIRFGATTGAEDERDLSKVNFSLPLYRAYAKGFLSACGKSLTRAELETLPMGAKLMTLECGVRFLTDHILGDVYFRIHRENHNLDRCRTQFKLVSDMEKCAETMSGAIAEI